MKEYWPLFGVAALVAGGCTIVEPIEYAETLCNTLPMADYSACASRVLDHHRSWAWETDLPPGYSTSGPFAMVVADRLYLGSYYSNPFAAAFRVSSGSSVCRGAYDALAGSPDAVLDIRCNDGRQGTGELVLDQRGRNGVGEVSFTDGTSGRIVFGHGAAGAAPLAEG